jgi:Ca2+-binding EF-hand superfamily protein
MTFEQFKKGIEATKPTHSKMAPTQETKKGSLRDYFYKQDANHDGILTLDEFVAFRATMGTEKATSIYNKLASLGGATTKGSVTGMTFEQFKKAVEAMKGSEGKK